MCNCRYIVCISMPVSLLAFVKLGARLKHVFTPVISCAFVTAVFVGILFEYEADLFGMVNTINYHGLALFIINHDEDCLTTNHDGSEMFRMAIDDC